MRIFAVTLIVLLFAIQASAQPKPQNVVVPLSHFGAIGAIAFSDDGRFAITASSDGSTSLWNGKNGEFLRSLGRHVFTVTGVALSADGSRGAIAGYDQQIDVWDTTLGKVVRTIKTKAVEAIAMSGDGRTLVALTDDKLATVWNLENGQKIANLEAQPKGIRSVSMSADGKRIVAMSHDLRALLFDAVSGKMLRELKASPRGGIKNTLDAATISRDGRKALANAGTTVYTWDLVQETQEGLTRMLMGAIDGPLSISGDGSVALYSQPSNKAALQRLEQSQIAHQFDAQTGHGSMLALSNDGTRAITHAPFDPDRSVPTAGLLWNAENGKLIATLRNSVAPVNAVAFDRDGKHIRIDTRAGVATTLDLTSGSVVQTKQLESSESPSYQRMPFPDGKHVLSLSFDGKAEMKAVDGNRVVRSFVHEGHVSCAAFGSNGKRVLTGSFDRLATLWNVDTGEKLQDFRGHADFVSSVAISANDNWVLTGSSDGSARLWHAATGTEVIRIYILNDGKDWFVMTPSGHFDGTPGALKQFKYRIDGKLKLVAFDSFAREFQRPGLLASTWKGDIPK